MVIGPLPHSQRISLGMKFPKAAKARVLAHPKGFARMVTREDLEDILIDRGYCCETQKMDWDDVKHVVGYHESSQTFRLSRIRPSRFTDRVLPAKRFKRWPIIAGIGEDGPSCRRSGLTLFDGLHRCAVANHRGYAYVWAYVPCRPDGRLMTARQFP